MGRSRLGFWFRTGVWLAGKVSVGFPRVFRDCPRFRDAYLPVNDLVAPRMIVFGCIFARGQEVWHPVILEDSETLGATVKPMKEQTMKSI